MGENSINPSQVYPLSNCLSQYMRNLDGKLSLV